MEVALVVIDSTRYWRTGLLTSFLNVLGDRISRYRWWVLLVWLVLIGIAIPGAGQVKNVLLGGSGTIQGSKSLAVDRLLYSDFDNPYTKALQVAFQDPQGNVEDASYAETVKACQRVLLQAKGVRQVLSYYDTHDSRMRSPDGHATLLIVGLKAASVQEEEALVPAIRQALASFKSQNMDIRVTGRSAITTDVNLFGAEDSSKAEGRAIPLTLIVLLLAFGSLVAAGIPLAMGIVSTTVTLALLFLAAQRMELSNLAQNISSMLGLALGIDYSLLMVNRYREALQNGKDSHDAIVETLSTSGKAVIFSGGTVLIGLVGLFFSPLLETQSVGIGGVLVVLVSVLASLTLVPALFAIAGPRINWPTALSKSLVRPEAIHAWRRWAGFVMDRPGRSLAIALVILLAMLAPVKHYVAGFPDRECLPPAMEARQGMDILDTMHLGWSVFPIYVVVKSPDDRPILSTANLPGLLQLSKALKADPRVTLVNSPVDLKAGMSPLAYAMLYSRPDQALKTYPAIQELFLSHDKRSVLYQVILKSETTLEQAKALVREIETWKLQGKLGVIVGGQPVYYNDFDQAMNRSFPVVIGFVVVATFFMLLLAFRSILIPIKAILMNLLAVGAGYGAMVAVFLMGWGKELIGLSQPINAIPQSIILIIFCVVFGLSMDYEVFLLSRMKESYDQTGDNRHSTLEGLAYTGSIITSAALIMTMIFGAFAWAEMVLVKMLGLGLAVAVLVDATIIRCVAVPAFMRLAGRWNWYPGAPLAKPLKVEPSTVTTVGE